MIEVCDFCGVQKAGEILVESPSKAVHICDRCVAVCAERIQEEKACARPS